LIRLITRGKGPLSLISCDTLSQNTKQISNLVCFLPLAQNINGKTLAAVFVWSEINW
jgi:mannitol-1-phosphate/altronate dehydrogenase